MLLSVRTRFKAVKANPLLGPALILFLSANIANAANLIFNMIFARLMGPAIFADLTLLLTLKLGVLSVLGALQFAFAEHIAKHSNGTENKANARRLSLQSLRVSVPIMFVVIASASVISSFLNFSSPRALALLALAIPFFLPMIFYRGLTQGHINIPKIVMSIQAEWVIRLIGSLILWTLGFGLEGIAIAVGLSIAAGFLFSTGRKDWARGQTAKTPNVQVVSATGALTTTALGITALPYLILQGAQILVLDSDILIAKAIFTPQMAGLVAGLLLIQRVFFFAFLSCSTLLQPYVAKQSEAERSPKELYTLLGAIGVITAAALAVIMPNSELVVNLMLGPEYTELSGIIGISALTGAAFITSHLCAIYGIAKGEHMSAKIVLGFGVLQLITLANLNVFFPDMGLYAYFSIKLCIQIICAIYVLGRIIISHRKKVITP